MDGEVGVIGRRRRRSNSSGNGYHRGGGGEGEEARGAGGMAMGAGAAAGGRSEWGSKGSFVSEPPKTVREGTMPSPASATEGTGNGIAAATGFSGGGDGDVGRRDDSSWDGGVSPNRTSMVGVASDAWGAAKRRKQEGNGSIVVGGDKAGAPAPEVGTESSPSTFFSFAISLGGLSFARRLVFVCAFLPCILRAPPRPPGLVVDNESVSSHRVCCFCCCVDVNLVVVRTGGLWF